jgi:hypothetical protein
LRSNDGIDKRGPTGRGDVFPIPSGKLPGTFILKVLDVSPLEAPNRKGEAKIPNWEGLSFRRDSMKDVLEVKVGTSNGYHRGFEEVCG